MFDRNQLTHLVIWPAESGAGYRLVDGEGEVLAQVAIGEQVLGSTIAKAVPQGLYIDVTGCTVVTLSGEVRVTTKGQFDTAVVVQRSRKTPEERLEALERRERVREQRQVKLAATNRKLADQLKQKGEQDDVLEETAQAVVADPSAAPEEAKVGNEGLSTEEAKPEAPVDA